MRQRRRALTLIDILVLVLIRVLNIVLDLDLVDDPIPVLIIGVRAFMVDLFAIVNSMVKVDL